MFDRSKLYCLRKFNAVARVPLPLGHSTRQYDGQLMLSGPDVAIEIRGTELLGFVNGAASHPSGQLAYMIDNYDASLLKGAEGLRQRDTDTVILAGKWHHVDFEMEPRFEAYLVHVVSQEGQVQSTFYQSEIFDWDYPGLGDGGGFGCTMTGDPKDDVAKLRRIAELHVNFDDNPTVSSSGRPYIDGVLWYPSEGTDLPVVISHVTGMNAYETELAFVQHPSLDPFEGEANKGPLGANIDDNRQFDVDAPSLGQFRGDVVIRNTHRPPEMTVDELMASTDASGYWTQMWDGKSEPYSRYQVANGRIPRGGDLLRRLEDPMAEHSMGNAYATDWEVVSGSMETRFRILAVGPHPVMDDSAI